MGIPLICLGLIGILLYKAMRNVWREDDTGKSIIILLSIYLSLGTGFYWFNAIDIGEKLNLIECIYDAVFSLVGAPYVTNDLSRIFGILYLFGGLQIAYTFADRIREKESWKRKQSRQ